MPGLNGISSTVLLVGRLGCGLTSLPFTMLKKIEALAGPSQLPTSVGEPVKLMRPSGQRGAGAAGGCARRACGAGAASCDWTRAEVAMPSAMVPMTSVLMLLRLRGRVAAQRLVVGRGGTHHFTGGLAGHAAGVGGAAAIPGKPAVHGHFFADLQTVALPAGAHEHVRRAHLESPVADLLGL